jgi:hypothetical protein
MASVKRRCDILGGLMNAAGDNVRWTDGRFERIELPTPSVTDFAEVNVEVAHVSASLVGSDTPSNELQSCVRRYQHILSSHEYGVSDRSLTTLCLVDDYNHSRGDDFSARLTRHVNYVEQLGCTIDYITFEADLELMRDQFLNVSSDRSVAKYIEKNRRSPCSAHIAIWYLIRLGKLGEGVPVFRRKRSSNKPFFAKQILSILPRYYDTFEERASILLGTNIEKGINQNINHAYFEAEPPSNLEYVLDLS